MIEWYPWLKTVHVGAVATTGALLLMRGFWMLRSPARLRRPWVRILPHVIDTVLLASAIGLMIAIRQYPPAQPWLTAKIVGLLAYIALGTIALKRGPTRTVRGLALGAAVAVFAYIVSVAIAHDPRGALAVMW